jgi:hypothetical protein
MFYVPVVMATDVANRFFRAFNFIGKSFRDVALMLLKNDFADYGLEITRFYLEHITLPPDIEAKLDKK